MLKAINPALCNLYWNIALKDRDLEGESIQKKNNPKIKEEAKAPVFNLNMIGSMLKSNLSSLRTLLTITERLNMFKALESLK